MSLSEQDSAALIARYEDWLGQLPADLSEEEGALLCLAVMARLRNAKLLTQLFAGAKDKPAMQARVDAVLRAVIGPGHALTQHGISRTLSARFGPAQLARVGEAIVQFHEALKASCGVQCFITSGTLLGIVRDGRVIPHDDDFDLAYVSAFSDRAGILAERREIHRFLRDHPVFRGRTRERHFTIEFAGAGTRFFFDLFPAWISEGRFNEVPLRPGAPAAEDILPLGTIDFYGVPVPAPRNPEALLEVNYGPGWRHPDPSFRFDFSQYGAHYWFLHEDFRRADFDA